MQCQLNFSLFLSFSFPLSFSLPFPLSLYFSFSSFCFSRYFQLLLILGLVIPLTSSSPLLLSTRHLELFYIYLLLASLLFLVFVYLDLLQVLYCTSGYYQTCSVTRLNMDILQPLF